MSLGVAEKLVPLNKIALHVNKQTSNVFCTVLIMLHHSSVSQKMPLVENESETSDVSHLQQNTYPSP